MAFRGIVLYSANQSQGGCHEAHGKISWLMGRVQRSLFPHLNECLKTPLTEQEQRLVAILEIAQVERHVPKSAARHCWAGRKPLEREALARAFVAKAFYRHPTTIDLIRALQSAENLRRICGFVNLKDIPSESTFSRAFAEFALSGLGNGAHETLVNDYLAGELIGHISRDSTAIVGREKSAKKVVREPKKPRKRGRPAKGEQREPAIEKRLDMQVLQSAEQAILELPVRCDCGTKKNAKGYKQSAERRFRCQQHHGQGPQQSNPAPDVWSHRTVRRPASPAARLDYQRSATT